jgi:hypothetical protein
MAVTILLPLRQHKLAVDAVYVEQLVESLKLLVLVDLESEYLVDSRSIVI